MNPYIVDITIKDNLREMQNRYDKRELIKIAREQQPRRSGVGRFIQTVVLLSGLGVAS